MIQLLGYVSQLEGKVPVTKSARDRVRLSAKEYSQNRSRRSRANSAIKKFFKTLKIGNTQDSIQAFRNAESQLRRGWTKGVFKKNTVSRRVSRLNKILKDSISSSD